MLPLLDALLAGQEQALSAATAARTEAEAELDKLQQTLGRAEQAEKLRLELTAALAGIGVQAALDEPLPPAKHVFTHKIWELGGWRGTAPACDLPDGYVWAAPEDLAEVYPVPNAFGAYVKAK